MNLNIRELIVSAEPTFNNTAELMNAEHSKFLKEGNQTYIFEGATKGKKGKKIINPELIKRLKAVTEN